MLFPSGFNCPAQYPKLVIRKELITGIIKLNGEYVDQTVSWWIARCVCHHHLLYAGPEFNYIAQLAIKRASK